MRYGIDIVAEDWEVERARCPHCAGKLRPSPSLLDTLRWSDRLGGWRDYKLREYHLGACTICFNLVAQGIPPRRLLPTSFACPVCRSTDIVPILRRGRECS